MRDKFTGKQVLFCLKMEAVDKWWMTDQLHPCDWVEFAVSQANEVGVARGYVAQHAYRVDPALHDIFEQLTA